MGETIRFGVSIDSQLLDSFDRVIADKKYTTRSEAIRDLIRDYLVELDWKTEDKEVVGTVTLVYNHETRDLTAKLAQLQHRLHSQIISTLHVHLDQHNCLEVLVVRGKSNEIQEVADQLIGTKGVKHGKLTMTTTGNELI
ncbi:CopG family transcriptional regulator, nickel-responsive regulator [Candidatus Hakubella thermalkaliphila]|uniref:Putative nickel-responsive regulator n=2 Tax=Candidatus Hakubella thermalkaliphila TaxID=2754717 RepID=A0A6V8PB05_9ACTN|nr:nickel-responsive transcriptional regulator NikR [Candidatus Hakubella thermalkaliphila]MBT9169826.1 putative nickel-responsive regulator [Actinomycetota bacterium]GFP20967.1 CopG family transcriptional regulator, nickel-responsive regulator [Candidatus Hakubella thermalkaliphila]GFP29457.1 CopG family transcriptional regulator, nickel-responsive regulator [Candidatus Hakubella thermalkaliphila]GFP36821.1 CopG family transcriptional regulator, nickel-responsive regulator [Candidatus Hakubell